MEKIAPPAQYYTDEDIPLPKEGASTNDDLYNYIQELLVFIDGLLDDRTSVREWVEDAKEAPQ